MGDEVKLVLRLPAELHERIKRLAAQDRRSLNGQILHILEQYAAKRKKTSPETAALLAELLERILAESDPRHDLSAVPEHGDAAQTTIAPGSRNNRDNATGTASTARRAGGKGDRIHGFEA